MGSRGPVHVSEDDEGGTDAGGGAGAGAGAGAGEQKAPAVWELLNTLTLGALDTITPLTEEVLRGAAALVGPKDEDEGKEEVPTPGALSHHYDADDERDKKEDK